MGLTAERTQRHRPGGEVLDDLGRRLDILELHRPAGGLQLHQPAQQPAAPGLLVDESRVLGVGLARVSVDPSCRVLKLGDRVGVPDVNLAVPTPLEHAANRQHVATGARIRAEVALHRLGR